MDQFKASRNKISQLIEIVESGAVVEQRVPNVKALGKRPANSRALKRHLKYVVPEIRLALIRESNFEPQQITSAEDLDKFIEPLKHYAEEHFVSFHLDVKFRVIGFQIVSRGTISASLVHPREVFKAAFLANSYAIIVAHNHPGGSLEPSPEDIITTEKLVAAGKLLGVNVLDHLIVTSSDFVSIREKHCELWM